MGNAGRREFIQVLRLMEGFQQYQVEQAVTQALSLGAISFDAVKMLLLARLENRPARLDLTFYPYLPAASVGATMRKTKLRGTARVDEVALCFNGVVFDFRRNDVVGQLSVLDAVIAGLDVAGKVLTDEAIE